jgi:Enoyl-(Acyl carrier protein) reductase
MKKLMSVGRFGRAEEVASAVSFLANPDLAFINGESLAVDGGFWTPSRICVSPGSLNRVVSGGENLAYRPLLAPQPYFEL